VDARETNPVTAAAEAIVEMESHEGTYLPMTRSEFLGAMQVAGDRLETIRDGLLARMSERTSSSDAELLGRIDPLRADLQRRMEELYLETGPGWKDLREEILRSEERLRQALIEAWARLDDEAVAGG